MSPDDFLQLADLFPDATLLLTRDGRILAGNRAFQQQFGLSPAELHGKTLREICPEGADAIEPLLPEMIESEERYAGATSLRCPVVPQVRWRFELKRLGPEQLALRLQPDTLRSTPVSGDFDLRSSRRVLQNVLDSAPAIIYIKDADGCFYLVNRQCCELAGRSLDEIVGRRDEEIFGGSFRAIRDNDRMVLESGRTLRFEEQLELADGTHHFLSIKSPLDDVGFPEPLLIGISTDVTDRVRAENEVARLLDRERTHSLRLTRLAAASLTVNSALSVDSVLKAITAEARTIIGAHQAASSLTSGDKSHQPASSVALSSKYADWEACPPPPDAIGIDTLVRRTNSPLRLTQAQLEAHPDWKGPGSRGPRHPPLRGWLGVPFIGRDGHNLGLIQLSEKYEGDFTEDDQTILVQLASIASVAIENTRLYQELRDADRRKDEFLAMLAHELRNPLSPIRNALVLLNMDDLDAETAAQARDIMSRQVEHLVRLVDDLLDVSRIMRGKIELRKEAVEVTAIVNRAVETSQPLIAGQQHEFSVTLPPHPVWVEADLVRMAQVISNLLNNSAKYTPPGGHIWLTVEQVEGGVRFRVRDNGMGIEPNLLPQVFDLFTQANRSIERSQGGLGIGLTLVRNLVEMHGGTVTAASDGPGAGSEFVVALPSSIQRPRPSPTEFTPLPTRPLRVLVVEDMVGSAKILATMLQKFWKHEVALAHDGLEALSLAKTFRPELVLLDIGLPGINGFEVARRLRQEAETRDALLVALTGYGTTEDRRKAEDAGFDEHLVKPASVHALQRLFAHSRLAK